MIAEQDHVGHTCVGDKLHYYGTHSVQRAFVQGYTSACRSWVTVLLLGSVVRAFAMAAAPTSPRPSSIAPTSVLSAPRVPLGASGRGTGGYNDILHSRTGWLPRYASPQRRHCSASADTQRALNLQHRRPLPNTPTHARGRDVRCEYAACAQTRANGERITGDALAHDANEIAHVIAASGVGVGVG